MLSELNWWVLALANLLFSCITVMPEVFARVNSKEKWVPVAAPPNSLGDNYHYFSALNHVHRRLLNCLHGLNLSAARFSVVLRFQAFGYYFNLIPYHIGYLIEDRRVGVVFVRIWNRWFLALSVNLFTALVYASFDVRPTSALLIFTFLFFFLTYPGPLGIYLANSILFNLNDKRHIFDRAHENDLTRAMFSETSAPLLVLAIGLFLWSGSLERPDITLITGALSTIILFAVYSPVAIYFAACFTILMLLKGYFLAPLVVSFGAISFLAYYSFLMSKCSIGKELFISNAERTSLEVNRYKLRILLSYLVPFSLLVLFFPAKPNTDSLFLYCVSATFLVTLILPKSHLFRLWIKAANIPFQAITSAVLISLIIPLLTANIIWVAILIAFIAICYFYYKQSRYLLESGATLVSINDGYLDELHRENRRKNKRESITIATNSTQLAYWVDLFSGEENLLRNYSIQQNGYRSHLERVLYNFKVLGCTYQECERLLTSKVDIRDWCTPEKRPFSRQSIAAKACYEHTLQYMATNRDYNQGLRIDGMYDKNGWTDKYKRLLETLWRQIDLGNYNQIHTYLLKNPY